METKELAGNTITIAGVFSYLMEIQGELTILLLITGLLINIIRIYDRIKNKNKKL